MSSIIDNREKTMLESLKNSLKNSERVDILTAFFYFSGFNALADELKEKKIRLLIGNTIDPGAITELCNNVKKNPDEPLDSYGIRGYDQLNNIQKKDAYTNSFIEMFNKSTLSEEFDSTESQNIFKMFLSKIEDGSLEIRLTAKTNHAKVYILTNKPEYSFSGDQKGVVFTGSSNFTFNGLLGQGEMNERFSDNTKYDEYLEKFEGLWSDSKAIDIAIKEGNSDFKKEIKRRLWIFSQPKPYEIYIRILYELFKPLDNNSIIYPDEITRGKYFNLKYQIDAVKQGIDCISKNNGVIIADVVGLGKSIIASSIAYNLNISKTIIIAPPHLVGQWNDYQQEFGLRGVKVYSSGKIGQLHEEYSSSSDPILYIIDEAHRYRNELSIDYQNLHQLTRSNPNNKVILLTATPYNNRPSDLFALVKLFQTPSRSTINSVNNLGARFHELIATYNKLSREGKQNLSKKIKVELNNLSDDLRTLIDPIIIRRSRIDLNEIKEYSDDLKRQKISFSNVEGPKLIEYDLGAIREIYLSTLSKISEKFTSARYNPSSYLVDLKSFNKKYGSLFGEMNIQLFQGNLAKFIKRLLVMRFESSKAAFKSTLENLIKSYMNIKKWWEKGYVPIKKSGFLEDPNDDDISETLDIINNDIEDFMMDLSKIKKKAIPFDKSLFKDTYIDDINNDLDLLNKIYNLWFGDNKIGEDPKYDKVKTEIKNSLSIDKNKKIVVFSSFADTAGYVANELSKDGFRVLLYTGGSSENDRNNVKSNFDASLPIQKQKNDYDIIVATDALSEGFNLNRCGVIINYDIPYNPTRVVQRIGRINRINKKVFEKISILNFFPTDIGESNTLIKGISVLKMYLINNIVGNDTKTLTPDETLASFFKTQYTEANVDDSKKSWDVDYKNTFDSIKHNTDFIEKLLRIPERVRIVRKGCKKPCSISFAKRGSNTLFAISIDNKEASIVPPENVLKFFAADENEISYSCDPDLDKKFIVLRNEIHKDYSKSRMNKRNLEAIKVLDQLSFFVLEEKDYLSDLINTIKVYDDLSDGELKFLAHFSVNKNNAFDIVKEIKERISNHYIVQIKRKAESIDAQAESIMFTEDLRYDNN